VRLARVELLFAGTGGQGIVLQGYLLGLSALYDGKNSTFIPSYGAEARGGESKAEVVISTEEIDYPYVTKANVVVVMATQAYDKFIGVLEEGGILLYEKEIVALDDRALHARRYGIPATRIAERLGERLVANVVMLGFLVGVTGVVGYEAMEKAIMEGVPSKYVKLNLRAFEEGYKYSAGVR